MPSLPNAPILLAMAAVVMALLVLRDLLRERRLTLAARIRLTVALIFTAVVLWLHRPGSV